MLKMGTVQTTSAVQKLDFKSLVDLGKDIFPEFIKDYGIVYVTSITRDGCSGCIEQKPLFEKLAEKIAEDYPGKARFSNIHIHYQENHTDESQEAKSLFGHTSYPTYMVQVKSRYGPLEHYRAAYPSMEELENQIVGAFELADYYEKEVENPS